MDFWAEVHLVQDANFCVQERTFRREISYVYSFFWILDWMDFWAEVHLVQDANFCVQERTFRREISYFTVSFGSWTGWTFGLKCI